MMVALRNALVGNKRLPSARSYIQDGLIAMWDGIENADWNTHDPNAIVWVDLKNGIGTFRKISSRGTMVPYSDYMEIAKATIQTDNKWNMSGSMSMELVFCKLAENVNKPAGVLQINPWVGINLELNKIRYTVGSDYDYANSDYLAIPTHYAITWDNSGKRFFRNGTLLATQTGTVQARNGYLYATFNPGGVDTSGGGIYESTLKINSCRIYNKKLTDAEIAINYTIDKKRFNLP